MRKLYLMLFVILLLPGILAINLEIEKTDFEEVAILNLDRPSTFNVEITNNGPSDDFNLYTFFGTLEEPKNAVRIDSGETKDIQIEILPSKSLEPGISNFELLVQDSNKDLTSKKILIQVINLKDAFEIGAEEFDPESNSLNLYIKNRVKYDFENMDVNFSSVFFNLEEDFSLGPKEKKTFEIELNSEDFEKVLAGFYTLRADIEVYEKNIQVEGTIKFTGKDILETTSQQYGFIVNTKTIEKTNEGNTIQTSETMVTKNILSRLFTSFSPEPDFVEREGAKIHYTWSKEIRPGETLEIKVRTNWFIPFLVIFFIVAIVVLVKRFLKRDLSIRKKVSFVKAKGGEFALKVSIIVHANKYLEKVNIIDRLPALVKVYERFGREVPTRIDENKRKIEWNFEKLESGEIRILSYVIYSKVGVVGKFALPSTTAIYEREGEIRDASSNMAFFVAEQRGKDNEED